MRPTRRNRAQVLEIRPGLADEAVDAIVNTYRGDPAAFLDWCREVLSYEVSIGSGGRAVVRAPDTSYRVDVQWETVQIDGQPVLWLKSACVVLDLGLSWPQVDLSKYLAAFIAAARSGGGDMGQFARGAPKYLPAGSSPDTGYYTDLLNALHRLKVEGHAAPGRELARRLNKNPATVRSHIMRARKYLKKEVEDGKD